LQFYQNNLTSLYCNYNQLTSLEFHSSSNDADLECSHNQLSSLIFSGSFNNLFCNNNQLTNLDFTNSPYIFYLDCRFNQLTSLDLSKTPSSNMYLQNNQLISINIKNGNSIMAIFSVDNNPNLQYVCADEDELQFLDPNATYVINSYCSFNPGGTFYTIQGNARFDGNNNGCNASDVNYPNLRYTISGNGVTGGTISNASGFYSIPVQAGSHTITPVLENPSYFTVSPTSITKSFPTTASPYTQNFCIASNGVHNDLEVIIIPVSFPLVGYDARYYVVCKNKGNQLQSGTLNLLFDDNVLDYVSSNPIIASQSSTNLNWNFTDLAPFETRYFEVYFNLNSPTETPALTSGDVLNYVASITNSSDETPIDNSFALNQTVYNSFDPNDKTCLEGATITPDKVGEYVHYMIRFENTGTANAQNIVVTDMIDTTKFDVATLVPIVGSHSFVTRITNPNKVEFIFENIQLPFDDANNDGYVAFKIKTKPTLAVGSSFSNTASIYFDYNFPIVTNTAITTIQALANSDFEFSNYFELAPNPAKNTLQIHSKNNLELSSISIYNTLGQLVLAIPSAKEIKTIDVSQLTAGTYFIKVISDKGSSNSKFVKE
jgi:hypothetical protein